jgi:hypothetical protein
VGGPDIGRSYNWDAGVGVEADGAFSKTCVEEINVGTADGP